MANPANRSTIPAAPVRVWRIAVRGEIDVATAPDVLTDVIDACPSPGDVVTIDLEAVTFMDSHGIASLLRIKDHLDNLGCHLELVNPSPCVQRLVTILGLNERFGTGPGTISAATTADR